MYAIRSYYVIGKTEPEITGAKLASIHEQQDQNLLKTSLTTSYEVSCGYPDGTEHDLIIRITSYNVCYTKLLRTVTVDRTAPTLNATQELDVFTGTETTQYDLTWAGNLSATYTYLKHAAPSFESGSSIDSLTLDFGSVEQNSTIGSLGFSIFNLADADRTGLDLISINATGDASVFGTDLIAFANLSQGGDLV